MASFYWDEIAKESNLLTVHPASSSAIRVGLVKQTEIGEVVSYLFPPSVVFGSANLVYLGAAHPDYSWLFADEIEFAPFADKITGPNTNTDFDTTPNYLYFKCKIKYVSQKYPVLPSNQNQPFDGDPVPFLDHKWTVGGQMLSLPGKSLKWQQSYITPPSQGSKDYGNDVPDDINAAFVVPTLEHHISWPRVKSPPFAAMRTCLGTVNQFVFTLASGTCARETLLFLGAEISADIMSDGTRSWQISYKFSERRVISGDSNDQANGAYPAIPGGWNHFYRPEAGYFGRMGSPNRTIRAWSNAFQVYYDANAIYTGSDFSTLYPV